MILFFIRRTSTYPQILDGVNSRFVSFSYNIIIYLFSSWRFQQNTDTYIQPINGHLRPVTPVASTVDNAEISGEEVYTSINDIGEEITESAGQIQPAGQNSDAYIQPIDDGYLRPVPVAASTVNEAEIGGEEYTYPIHDICTEVFRKSK